MSVVTKVAGFLERRISRRSFLGRAAMVGSALAIAPMRFATRPGSAYRAICNCRGQACSCSSRCCGGYTEFCCTMYGENECPPNSIAAGWWKVDSSHFCTDEGVARPRYYIDCNSVCGSCGCGGSGLCHWNCAWCDCECGNGDCSAFKTCCILFRYGQCNQGTRCVGSIICRVITCTPPWEIEPSCRPSSATDNATRFHDAACLHPRASITALPAVFSGGQWQVRNSSDEGGPTVTFDFGTAADVPVMGDWNDDGIRTVGVVRGIYGGRLGDDRVTWLLRDLNSAGAPDRTVVFGQLGDIPVVGDWDGDGNESPGLFRDGLWLLKNGFGGSQPDAEFEFGRAGDIPLVGDWDGDGSVGIGVYRDGTFRLKNSPGPGAPDLVYDFGDPGDHPVVGDWDGDGIATVGVVRDGVWMLANQHNPTQPDLVFAFGDPAGTAVPWGRSSSVRTTRRHLDIIR